MKTKNKLYTFVLPGILILLFVILTICVKKDLLLSFDNAIYNLISHNNFMTKFMKFVTSFGENITLSFLAILLFIVLKNKKISLFIPLNLMIIGGINHSLKFLIQRPRPLNKLIEASGFSFPSGHTAASLAFYGFLIFLIYKKVKNKLLKNLLIILLAMLIILIGLSRIYLHVHFPTDVLGSILYSSAYLMIFIKLFEKAINNIDN